MANISARNFQHIYLRYILRDSGIISGGLLVLTLKDRNHFSGCTLGKTSMYHFWSLEFDQKGVHID